jgi:hypothetical protein
MAEIYGSFGRIITGNTLGGSIGALARQILSDKIRRIFQAYRDETTFEGALVSADVAIQKLTDLLGTVGATSDAAKDIKEYIDLIRQEARTRKVNDAVTALASADLSTKDYGVLIKTMREVLADPTITATEKETLTSAIATQTRNYVNLLLEQFSSGKSVTVDGKVINFDIAGNSDQLVGLIESVIADNPTMKQEFGSSMDIARAFTIVKKAQFDAANISDATDAGKLKSERLMLKAYESAKSLLDGSQYDVLQSDEYLKIVEYLDTTKSNIATYEKNITAKANAEKAQKGYDRIGSVLNQIDEFGSKTLKGGESAYLGGYNTMLDLMRSQKITINDIDTYLDAIARNNGGERSFIGENGEKISFDMLSMAEYFKDAYNTANSMYKFAMGQEGYREWANTYKGIADGIGIFVQNSDYFTVEDKYDAARKKLQTDIEASNGDIFAMRQAYVRFGETLSGIAFTLGEDSSIYDNLKAESNFFKTGTYDEDRPDFYGENSGNFPYDPQDDLWSNYVGKPAEVFEWTNDVDKSMLTTYRDAFGKETTPVPGTDIWKDEFGNTYKAPDWGLNGIASTDVRGRSVVNQVIDARDRTGKIIGFVSFVNGKAVMGRYLDDGAKLGFLSQSSINTAFGGGLTESQFQAMLSGSAGGLFFSVTDNYKELFNQSLEFTITRFEARNGGYEVNSNAENAGVGSNEETLDDQVREWFKNKEYTFRQVPKRGIVLTATDSEGNVIDIKEVMGEEFFNRAVTLIKNNNLETPDPTGSTNKPEEVKIVSGDETFGVMDWAKRRGTPPTAPAAPQYGIGSSGYVTRTNTDTSRTGTTPLVQGATLPTAANNPYMMLQTGVPMGGTSPYTPPAPTPPAPPKPTPVPTPPRLSAKDPTGTGLTRDTAWGTGGYGTSSSTGGFFRNIPGGRIAL